MVASGPPQIVEFLDPPARDHMLSLACAPAACGGALEFTKQHSFAIIGLITLSLRYHSHIMNFIELYHSGLLVYFEMHTDDHDQF